MLQAVLQQKARPAAGMLLPTHDPTQYAKARKSTNVVKLLMKDFVSANHPRH